MMIEDPVAEFIEAAADGLCTAYVVVATVERIDGSQSFWITTLNRQTSSTTLGLLVSATSAEQYRIAKCAPLNGRTGIVQTERLLRFPSCLVKLLVTPFP